MKPKTLLVLTVLALGLGGFIFFFEKDLASTDERKEAETKVLELETDEVRALVLEWSGVGDAGGASAGEPSAVHLEKREPTESEDGEDEGLDLLDSSASWRITRPIEARADADDVRALLDRLAALRKSRTVDDIDPAELGFDPPRGAVTLTTDAGDLRLEVGIDLPLSGDLVVRRADTPSVAYRVSSSPELLEELGRQAGDWRDERLFAGPRTEVERLALETVALPSDASAEVAPSERGAEGERILLVRRGPGETYWLESPLVDRADTSEVNGLLNLLTGLEAEVFLEDGAGAGDAGSGAEVRTEPPLGSFELGLRDRETPWRVALLGGGIAEVGGERVRIDDAPLREALNKGVEAWRSRAWSPLQVFALEWARFDDGEGPFEVSRDAGNWTRDEEQIPYSAATDALYPLNETRAEALLSPAGARAAGFDLDETRLEVVLGTKTEEATLRLLGRAAYLGETLDAATLEGRDTVLLLPAEEIDELLEKVRILRAAEPVTEGDQEES